MPSHNVAELRREAHQAIAHGQQLFPNPVNKVDVTARKKQAKQRSYLQRGVVAVGMGNRNRSLGVE